MTASDTIFALGSGRLPAAIGVVRLSGPKTAIVIEALANTLPPHRQLAPRALRDTEGHLIDHGMVVFFQGPRSETGEDCGEFHIHGGRAILDRLFATLRAHGLRMAEPGEFSRRAFLNGKADLVQTEAVADLVAAETEAERRFAADNLGGRQSALYASWRKRMLHARAMIEAELDFSDEGDVPGSVAERIWADMTALRGDVLAHLGGFARVNQMREGFEVVILGAPNAGKSTLLNALAQREAAIVSDEAGTTRDLIEVQLSLDGNRVRLVDTAGLRESAGRVESIGIARALERARTAKLVLHLIDLSEPQPQSLPETHANVVTLGSKADLAGSTRPDTDLTISAETGEGIETLLSLIGSQAASSLGDLGETLPSRERHAAHLRVAAAELEGALIEDRPLELRAESLRLAATALGRITGEIGTEDVLGEIFSSFCIGK
ncbi:MAG: tRNA uridine-5-carboxymethylaminomethyl(34) synthesis GTPase MnmE [Methylobacterium mesophilicum]|nr:tRNA uridine-5-carboxymethylaminomethyl(34) synthesis GTPase MnmE [Methylobacterium mesophilicum]